MQYFAIVNLIINDAIFEVDGKPVRIGLAINAGTPEQALAKINKGKYEFVIWNDDYKGEDCLVKVIK